MSLNVIKKAIPLFAVLVSGVVLTGCATTGNTSAQTNVGTENTGDKQSNDKVLNIAYQYGTAYDPLIIAKENKYIEEKYKAETGNDLTINWQQMPKGADINTGIAAGEIQAGFMGTAPAITGCVKGVGYKIFTNLSGQEHQMYTNSSEVTSIADIVGSDFQVALVNNGSIQHIILAMTLVDNGFDAHALDSNIVAMSHPDGMVALQSGSVACQLTTSPYIYSEAEDSNLSLVPEIGETWSKDNSFIVGVASETLYNDDSVLYNALCSGISDAIDYVNTNPEETAKITATYNGDTEADELTYIEKGNYSTKTCNLLSTAEFMVENGFIEADSVSMEKLVFSNVEGD